MTYVHGGVYKAVLLKEAVSIGDLNTIISWAKERVWGSKLWEGRKAQ